MCINYKPILWGHGETGLEQETHNKHTNQPEDAIRRLGKSLPIPWYLQCLYLKPWSCRQMGPIWHFSLLYSYILPAPFLALCLFPSLPLFFLGLICIENMKGGHRRIFRPPVDAQKDRDDDLLLFHEMRRREKERSVNLLLVSDELESNSGMLW